MKTTPTPAPAGPQAAETIVSPFYVHRRPSLAERRPATLAECRQAVRSTYQGRHSPDGEWFFPFYGGHDREQVQAWLDSLEETHPDAP